MTLLSIGKHIEHGNLQIEYLPSSHIDTIEEISKYSYIIINGGDGAIRRALRTFYLKFGSEAIPPFIINPTGSFNVLAKWYRLPKVKNILDALVQERQITIINSPFYAIDNRKIFLFSAGNGSDVAHIFISEVLRFGLLKNGFLRYLVSFLLLLPFHLFAGIFILLSKKRFFIFTPLKFRKFLNIYGRIDDDIEIDLDNHYNVLQFDGDLSVVKKPKISIKKIGEIRFISL